MIKYAEILDSSWWQEEVPVGFPDRTKDIGTEEEPNVVAKTWEEYCTNNQGTKQQRFATKDVDGVETNYKEFVTFIKDGNSTTGTIVVPESYSSDKLRFVTEREMDIYVGNKYLIHLFTKYDINESPEDINWTSELSVELSPSPYAWKGQILTKKFYYEDLVILEKEYYHTRNQTSGLKETKGKRIYWYKADGTRHLLKDPPARILKTKKLQVEDRINQTSYAISEAYATTVGTPVQPFADAYFESHATLVEQDKLRGSTLFRDQIASETNETAAWLFYTYDVSHLTHDHGLGENPTIQEVLVDYLTFE